MLRIPLLLMEQITQNNIMNSKFTYFVFLSLISIFCYQAKANSYNVQFNYNKNHWENKSYTSSLTLLPYFDLNVHFQDLSSILDCSVSINLPFVESFNTGTTTLNCWDIIDQNKDSTTPTGNNIWKTSTSGYEVGQSMYFYGGPKNDDWLISPQFTLDETKVYKLKYYFKTSLNSTDEFEVLASNSGKSTPNFTIPIEAKKIHNEANWKEQTTFITNLKGDIHFAWHVTSQAFSTLYIDQITLEEVACIEPQNLKTKNIDTNEATISWEDTTNTSWEYYVELEGGMGPSNSGTLATNSEVKILKDAENKNLTPSTNYNYYVRAKCSSGTFGNWIGPIKFKTSCIPYTTPFVERFNNSSDSFDCWTLLDNNNDKNPINKYNSWTTINAPYEGDRAVYFLSSSANSNHDDYLITPKVKLDGGIYALTYYYKTSNSNDNEFEILLSKNGIDVSEFNVVIQKREKRNQLNYTKQTVHISGITGDVNLAWHIVGKGASQVFIDYVTIEEVGCIAPTNQITIDGLLKDQAKISWIDDINSDWEYFVQPMGASITPTGSGTLAKSKSVTITKTNGPGSTNLQPNTTYEFFVRSTCGLGKNSLWTGPLQFTTPCDEMSLPFFEGFNKSSTTRDCWGIIDNNNDAVSISTNIFFTSTFGQLEGDQAMYFNGNPTPVAHDDWLVSPSFSISATKYYRLKYSYKTSTMSNTNFEVLLSSGGIAPNKFTEKLLVKEKESSNDWKEEVHIITGVTGTINIAWHVNTPKLTSHLFIDAVSFEEIKTCPEPLHLDSKDEKLDSATLLWSDEFGKNWEYIVQKSDGPIPTGNGVATNSKENIVTKDFSGNNLKANQEYEFYVRTICGNGEFSIWSGPYKFRTTCDVFNTPFWEGFNTNSRSIYCWKIVDGNNDATSAISSNIWKTATTNFEGTHMMFFHGNATDQTKLPHNDWLISPTLKFEAGKNYRLKYHYKTLASAKVDHEFEVLVSNEGDQTKDFKKTIVPRKKYEPSDLWKQEYVYISGISGDINLAWHVTSSTSATFIYIDNIFVEEVQNCPEPLNLDAQDIKHNEVELSWSDEYGATSWEYFVQKKDNGEPKSNGTSTSKKTNKVTQEQSGENLEPNKNYEFYVRTICSDGSYSIWKGPFQFTTSCYIFTPPFWEGFNTDSETIKCWTILDSNADATSPTGNNIWKTNTFGAYEGNQFMYFMANRLDVNKALADDDWLISPALDLDGSDYILKFHYRTQFATYTTPNIFDSSFEVLLSTNGMGKDNFTKVLVPSKVHRLNDYVEYIVYIKDVKDIAHIAWHVNSKDTNYSYLYLDNIFLKKIEGCEEPFSIKTTNQTDTSIDIEWQQNGSSTSWEVLVVPFGKDETATPVQKLSVTGSPNTIITGLNPGNSYTFYVRAKCSDGTTFSEWSTPKSSGTKIQGNDDCSGATNMPVNKNLACNKTVTGSLIGATKSKELTPSCNNAVQNDVWYEFTAEATTQSLSLLDFENLSLNGNTSTPYLYAVLYDQPCGSMTVNTLGCFSLNKAMPEVFFYDLIEGNKYYLRLSAPVSSPNIIFELCLSTSEYKPLIVSPSGDKYNVSELVSDILIQSKCDLVSNVKYQNGDGGLEAQKYNTLGYFNKGNSDFPFEEGIVLSTNEIEYVGRTYRGNDLNVNRGNNNVRWKGDDDINDAIFDAGGGLSAEKRVTQIEFDFIPIKGTVSFEYLFASQSYHVNCGVACHAGAMFAAWLVDTTTGEGQNLAKVTNTDLPIAINTIRDANKSKSGCGSTNPELFGKYYGETDDILDSPVDFVGLTKAMKSVEAEVIPGRKYHIKLAVIDFCTTIAHSSAVFFNSGSFDLGNLDLGPDLLVETGTALCNGETRTIKSGLGTEGVTIEWFKDNVLIPGKTIPDLEVNESGNYKVVAYYPEIKCEVSGEIAVEIYPAISETVSNPINLEVCRNSLEKQIIDLLVAEKNMFNKTVKDNYSTSYYTTEEDANSKSNEISTNIEIVSKENITFYIRVEDKRTGCHQVFPFNILIQSGEFPNSRDNVSVCASYTLPSLEENQYYYSESGAKGTEYKAGDTLTEAGEHTIYVLQRNGEEGCYEEINYKVSITEAVKADVFEDEVRDCDLYILAPLSPNNRYFTRPGGPHGEGHELQIGTVLQLAQTVYVYASSQDELCIDESSFTVKYEECPIQKGISPNGDGINDQFDLSNHGVLDLKIYNRYGTEVYSYGAGYTNEWIGQDKNGKGLPDGTYYYVVISRETTRTGWVQINR